MSDTQNDAVKPTIIDLDPDQVTEHVPEGTEESPSPPPSTPAGKRRLPVAASLAALTIAAVAGGWIYRDMLSDYYPSDKMTAVLQRAQALETSNTQLAEKLQGLERLSTQLKSDVDALETKAASAESLVQAANDGLASSGNRFSSIEASLQEAQQQIASLASRPQVTASGAAIPADSAALSAFETRLATLEKDVASLKSAPVATTSDTTVLSQSLSDLKAKIASGAGYQPELERIQRMVPAAEGLDVLAQNAANGLPDAAGLSAELTAMIEQLPKPGVLVQPAEDDTLWNRMWNALSGLIKIRYSEQADWPTTAAAAAALASSGDLSQAIDQVNSVEGVKPPGIQQWLDRATARLKQEQALHAVEKAVLRVIAAKG